ncbi:hypothetical protein BDW62DRAFT_119422 [Aspergillus aurantiobrunneus]
MKLSLVALSSVLALVAAQDSSSTTTTTTDAPATTQSLTPAERCLLACDENDRCCRAQCIGVPCPSDQQANDTNSCVAQCDQGSGSEADTQAYAQCQARCITTTFFPGTVTVTDAPSSTGSDSSATTTGGSSDNSDDSNDDSNSDDSNSGSETATDSDSPSATASGDAPDETNAAIKLGASAAGLAGFLVAAWAL